MTPKATTITTPDSMCPERCPICKERCANRSGHSMCATAGRGLAELHSCRRHVWGTLAEWCEAQRACARLARREVMESIKNCARCLAIVKRLGS